MVFDDKECKCVWNVNKVGKEIFLVDKYYGLWYIWVIYLNVIN